MHETLLARRYAKAFFELALEMNILDVVWNDMGQVHTVIEASRDFKLMLKSPVIRAVKKAKIAGEVFTEHINELTLNFILLIIKQRRESILYEIVVEFIDMYKVHNKIFTTRLTTPVKITDEIKNKLTGVLESATGGTAELIEKVDENIIGGFILNYKDKQYDASIRREINNLRREFEINLYKRKV